MADNTERNEYTSPAPARRAANVKTASGINILAGVWLIIAPFVLVFWRDAPATWNMIVCGILVVALAATRVAGPLRTQWASWTNLVLGIWLIISPWVLNYAPLRTPMWNSIVLGVIVGAVAICSAVATPRTEQRAYTEPL
ncbi:MAG: SPW repeat protein [Planctomycetota bacterium]